MGILDSIVEWIATQVMNLLDLITGSVLGALGCDMSTFLRYFPAAETLYEVFVAIGVGFILLNLVWQLFRNFGLGLGLSAEDPVKLAIKSILFIFLALFADQIMVLVLGIVGTPYDWVVDTALPPIEFASFASVVTVLVGSLVSGSVSLIVLILVLIVAWNYSEFNLAKELEDEAEVRAVVPCHGIGALYYLGDGRTEIKPCPLAYLMSDGSLEPVEFADHYDIEECASEGGIGFVGFVPMP